MKQEEYNKLFQLEFINKGKPFSMPIWTVEKQESAIAKVSEYKKEHNLSDKETDSNYKFFVIVETLVEIDASCTIEIVKREVVHPLDIQDLFLAVYNAGRKGIYALDFQKRNEIKKLKK